MNDRIISLPNDNSKTPINDPTAANFHHVSAAQLIINNNPFDKQNMGEESNIMVAIRVRPLLHKETSINDIDIIRNEGNLLIVLDRVEYEHEQENKKIMDVLHRSKEQRYVFDKIFREHSQEQIYQETCKGLIKPVLDGFNACVFAYGPTGTGKTHTMIGNSEIPGLNVLTIRDVFDSIKRTPDREFTVNASYVEIYNETIRDLFVPSSGYLELRDDPIKGVQIAGVTELKVDSSEQIMSLIFAGNRRRTTEATNANQTSSRSHAVFQIFVSSSLRTKGTHIEHNIGKLSLIDLAGSERGTVTENRGIRLREGAKINRSLLALANCINALGDQAKKGSFVPYRDSKLTRLLKDSLGGNSKTVMIANISPAGGQVEETLNTLKYASRAKNIKTKVISNKKLVSLHIAEYKNIIDDLKQEIDQLKSQMHSGINNPLISNDSGYTANVVASDSSKQGKDGQCPCWCGRAQDDIEMKKVQTEIFENFQERIQLRRALMELEEQNALNYLEIKRKQAEIMVWRKKDMMESQSNFGAFLNNKNQDSNEENQSPSLNEEKRPLSAVPNEIKSEFRNIQTLRMSTDKNTMRREVMNLRLTENIGVAKQIRDSIPKRIKHQDKKEFLEMIIKNHVLELQNIELEIHLQIQEKTVNDLKNIIQSQKKIIEEHKIDTNIKIPWDGEDASDGLSPNDSQDMDIDDMVYDDDPEHNAQNEEDEDVDFEAMDYKEILEKNKKSGHDSAAKPQVLNNLNAARGRAKVGSEGQIETVRSRAESKNRKQIEEAKILENNYMSEEKKHEDEREDNNSPRGIRRINGSNAPSGSKNDISVSSISAAKDQNAQQKMVKKTQSTNSNTIQNNVLPPLNPNQGGSTSNTTRNASVNSSNQKAPLPQQASNNSKDQSKDSGPKFKANLAAVNIYGKKSKR